MDRFKRRIGLYIISCLMLLSATFGISLAAVPNLSFVQTSSQTSEQTTADDEEKSATGDTSWLGPNSEKCVENEYQTEKDDGGGIRVFRNVYIGNIRGLGGLCVFG